MRGRLALSGAALAGVAVFATLGLASGSDGPDLTSVPTAQPRATGYAPAHQLSPELREAVVASGSTPLENPQGIIGWYGYENDAPSPDNPALPLMVPAAGGTTEAQKTEPDKNTYLVLKGQKGADPNYDYGTHFLFQGHEAAAKDQQGNDLGYITRINLDADTAHRVTLMASKDVNGANLATIDGSTWDPFAQRLLFTTEDPDALTYAATVSFPSRVEDVSGSLGRGGYEGIQNDKDGNVWIVEDQSGPNKGTTKAKQPGSFIFRFAPASPGDLNHGKLQALQVLNQSGQPITFASQAALNAPDQVLLHTYGVTLSTRWVTVHDTAVNGTAPFNANDAAKAANATPFKRPENGVFRPGSSFKEFFFTETGDTNATSAENGDPTTGAGGAGGWGSLFKLTQPNPSASTGKIMMFFRGNESVTGLDNVTFLGRDEFSAVEDAGDTLHSQRNGLDSGFVFDAETDYSKGAQPVRWLAEGRDATAALDAANDGFGKNDSDNEITGTHVSNGDPGPDGILGAHTPHLDHSKWRWFWTAQHGDNDTFEVRLADEDDD